MEKFYITGGMNRLVQRQWLWISQGLMCLYQFDFIYFTEDTCHYDTEIGELGGRIFRISDKNPISRFLALINS